MRCKCLIIVLTLCSCICPVVAQVQARRPEPGLWWGISPSVSIDEPLQIQATAEGLVIVSAPLGKTPVSWGPIAVAADGTIEFHRAGDSSQICTLKPTEYDTYVGSCRGSVSRRFTLARRGNPGGFEVAVDDKDFQILAKARQILSGPAAWNRHDNRVCDDTRTKQSWSLYCALYEASLAVTGIHLPGRPVIQETRVAAIEVAHRQFQRSLLDFNNSESTTYPDIAKVFDLAERRLRTMRACVQSPAAKVFADSTSAATSDGGEALYWRERIGHTLNGQTYALANYLGPMNRAGKIPDDWVAESASVKRRNLPVDWRHGVDAKGRLANGNQWRYASWCGESLDYYDVPNEVANYFDRLIDRAYFHGSKSFH